MKYERVCRELVRTSKELNRARDEFRAAVEELASCKLSNWSLDDLTRYVDLGVKEYMR